MKIETKKEFQQLAEKIQAEAPTGNLYLYKHGVSMNAVKGYIDTLPDSVPLEAVFVGALCMGIEIGERKS